MGWTKNKPRRTTMNAKLKKTIATAIFALTAGIAILPVSTAAQGKNSLVGAWDIVITFRDCTTGTPIRERPGLISFMFGGVMQEFGTGQQIPQNRTDSQGNWTHVDGRHYFSVAKAFRFNTDHSLAGTAKLFRNIQLIDGSAFSTDVRSEIYDVNGVLISEGCATEAGTRLE
jgi:hypothetical protein